MILKYIYIMVTIYTQKTKKEGREKIYKIDLRKNGTKKILTVIPINHRRHEEQKTQDYGTQDP